MSVSAAEYQLEFLERFQHLLESGLFVGALGWLRGREMIALDDWTRTLSA
ncbi:MAG: hypothetical protein V9E82_09000 [Candidatus Nanopelagicales bacterium]